MAIDWGAEVEAQAVRLCARSLTIVQLCYAAWIFGDGLPHDDFVSMTPAVAGAPSLPDASAYPFPLPDTIYVVYTECAPDAPAPLYRPPFGEVAGGVVPLRPDDVRLFAPQCESAQPDDHAAPDGRGREGGGSDAPGQPRDTVPYPVRTPADRRYA